MITREQMKAARALLDWSQKDLAEKSGVSEATIKLIETAKIHSKPDTLQQIQESIEAAGIEFLPQMGVRFRDDLLTVIESRSDENIFLRLLDDIFYTLQGIKGEALWSFVDEALSPLEIIERDKSIKKSGISYRNLIRYGDTSFHGHIDEYRWLPRGHFLHNLTVIYRDKFAMVVNRPNSHEIEKIIIIHDRSIAEMKQKEFEIIWQLSEKPHATKGKAK